jgi:hypothetical protein
MKIKKGCPGGQLFLFYMYLSPMPLDRCLCFALVVMIILSCQKEQDSLPKLASFSDNNNKYSVYYNGSQVSEINVDSGAGAPYIIAKYSYSQNLIRSTLHANTGYSRIDYYMKNSTLPLNIKKYKNIGGVETMVSKTAFYYNYTGALDSVTLDAAAHFNFTPVYSGGNISDYYLSTEYGAPVLAGSFLYYPITNVFKATNPLLFIYSSPVFQFETFMLPRLFSSGTMKKFNGGSFVYDTDIKGNLSLEDYGTTFPYKRTYLYR